MKRPGAVTRTLGRLASGDVREVLQRVVGERGVDGRAHQRRRSLVPKDTVHSSRSRERLQAAGGRPRMSFFKDLLAKPADLSTASKYSVINGYVYLALGGLLLLWPGAVQTIFKDASFVGNESALFRVAGMTVVVIGWLYVFGGRSGARQLGPASVLDRVILVPVVLVPLVDGRCVPSHVGRVRGSRSCTRHRCVVAPQPRDVAVRCPIGADCVCHRSGKRHRRRSFVP